MKSLWQNTADLPDFPTLRGNHKTDVLIIGGGIAGILTAYFLKNKGIDYLLVEKDRICGGTTGNTTAKITVQHGLTYEKILKSNGVEAAKLYLKANKVAFDKYRELTKCIDCDYEIKDNFVYSQDRNKLFREMNALSIIGCNAKLYDSLPIPVSTAGAVCFPNQAQFHPLKFLSVIS